MSSTLERLAAQFQTAKKPNGRPIESHQYVPNPDLQDEEIIKAPNFPLDVYPDRMKTIITDCYNYLGYPIDFMACGVLAATAIAIGRTHRVVYTWNETSCLFMALVTPPGTAKSHPLKFALDPIIKANKKAIRDYNQSLNQLAEIGAPTEKIRDRQCLFSDFTIEALVRAVQKNARGVGVYIDELRAWFQNFNRYNSGSEQEFWLQNWSGTPLAVTRMTKKAFLEWPAISVVGTIQPSLLEDIGKGGRAQNGFVERMLFCYPDEVPVIMLKKRLERSDTYHILQKNYLPILQVLLDKQLAIEGMEEEDDQPHEVYLDAKADDFLTDFLNDLKMKMDELQNEYLRNVYSKLQSYAIRFCLLINRLDYACACQDNKEFPPHDDLTITYEQAFRACVLTEYFLKHALKTNAYVNGGTPVATLPRDQRNWYKELPMGKVFNTSEAEVIAVKHRISRATMYRLLNQNDAMKRLFLKVRHGEYERLYV